MTAIVDLDQATAEGMIESLRKGVPPRRNASAYSAGTDFVKAVRRRHLNNGIGNGKIRFVNGSWGAGKTHFFRLLREEAFDANLLVSTVELSAEQTPFNEFERVFYDIVRHIASPRMYAAGAMDSALPFGEVLKEVLERQAELLGSDADAVEELCTDLMAQSSIDIDFRRVVSAYWRTFLAETEAPVVAEETRGRLLQWFEGEGHASAVRRDLGIQKMVTKENARLFLASLGQFVLWLGFGGLVILFDESEMTHSTMRKSSLKQAHNNLLHLINEIDQSQGLFLLYAAVPEFFNDERTGIKAYGALAARIGAPEQRPPRPLDRVWNLDEAQTSLEDFADAASRVREIYLRAYPDDADGLIGEEDLRERVTVLVQRHPEFASVSAWRVVITATVDSLDESLDGGSLPNPAVHYTRIMDRFSDD